ncbi:hypothetical protein [Thermodesulfatator atlanticus]|uniref:hypothetical protein n=1 Tax=Thermodesulfatator atlanticus TaxID=501497 RepID=UPI0003B74089|nr:hypothetical protein [Thermodesulfatator atlanticus]
MIRALASFLLAISYIFLAAHFLRAGQTIFAGLLACLPLGLFFKKRQIRLVLSLGLYLGSLEWVKTYLWLKKFYQLHHMPFDKAQLILGVVIFVTLMAANLNLSISIKPLNKG